MDGLDADVVDAGEAVVVELAALVELSWVRIPNRPLPPSRSLLPLLAIELPVELAGELCPVAVVAGACCGPSEEAVVVELAGVVLARKEAVLVLESEWLNRGGSEVSDISHRRDARH